MVNSSKKIQKISSISFMHHISIAMLLFLSAVTFQSLYAQTTNLDMKPVSPPYIAHTSNFMAIAFRLEADEVQKLLPANVKVKSDDEGLATGGMEIYTTDQVYGVSKYTIAFIYVEVNAPDSANSSGNWPIWGIVNNETTLQNFKQFYHFPYHQEKKMTIKKGTEQIATIGDSNGEGLTLKLKRKTDRPVSAQGLATILSPSENGGILKTEIPWIANGHQASVVSFEVKAGSNKVLQVIWGAKPFYAQVSTNVFSYTRPVVQ
jgi:hypothetical protein